MRIAAVVLAIGGLASFCNATAIAAAREVPAAPAGTPASGAAPAPAPTEEQVLPAPSGNIDKPNVVAVMAAVGDRLSMSRQQMSTGTHIDPTRRKTIRVPDQILNASVLRGLDRGISQEYPDAARVLLAWTPPEALQQQLDDIKGLDRDKLLLDAVIEHLRAVPLRAQWDRIELIIPKYRRFEANGMGNKLQGIGVFVQPLASNKDLLDESMPPGDSDGDQRVVNPNTGEVVRKSTFVAPYMFFERVTLDPRTLAVVKRQAQYEATKYHDPMSESIDVAGHLPPSLLAEKIDELAERAAYQSIRGKSSVEVSAPKAVSGMPPAQPASGASR